MRELTDLELLEITGGLDLQPIDTPFPGDDEEGDGDNGDAVLPLPDPKNNGPIGGGIPVIIHWNPDNG